MGRIGKMVSLVLALVILVTGVFIYAKTRIPQLSEAELRERGVLILPRPKEIDPFLLEDDSDDGFTKADLLGKWSFLFFGFTHCPDICPTSMAEMGKAMVALGEAEREVKHPSQGVLISVDPYRDTPEQVIAYARVFASSFTGATGSRSALTELSQQVNVVFNRVPDGQSGLTVEHTGNIVIINPHGHYCGLIKLPHRAETIRLTYQSLAARF